MGTELSFLMLGTGVEDLWRGIKFFCIELLGYHIFLPIHDRISKFLNKFLP